MTKKNSSKEDRKNQQLKKKLLKRVEIWLDNVVEHSDSVYETMKIDVVGSSFSKMITAQVSVELHEDWLVSEYHLPESK